MTDTDDQATPEPDRGFWSQTDELDHVYRFARSRRASPYACLGTVLRNATSCVEPYVVLPPIVGGCVSVNLFTVAAGRSGQGKGTGEAAGTDAVRFIDMNCDDAAAEKPSIGTGEGLARLFAGSKTQPALTRANVVVAEVQTLGALMDRKGATICGELLKAFMGEPLGFNNSQQETTTAVKAHAYRLCLGVGVQPENASFFLSREKDGFPQRFLWLPTTDSFAPYERPAPVDPLHVVVPEFTKEHGRHVVQVPEYVWHDIDSHRVRVLKGDPDVDPLDGHIKLTQLKVAFALAVLHGQTSVSDEHWKIAGDLIGVSIIVRERQREAVAAARRRQNHAKAYEQADREQIVSERMSDAAQKRVVKAVCGKLRRVGRATRNELRRACTATIRSEFDTILDFLLDKQIIAECSPNSNQSTSEYMLVTSHSESGI